MKKIAFPVAIGNKNASMAPLLRLLRRNTKQRTDGTKP
jgi:hypothetical protein